MATVSIEQRVAALEVEVARLKAQVEEKEKTGFKAIYGSFRNDPIYAEAMRLGREYRESLRPKPRRPGRSVTQRRKRAMKARKA